MSAGPDGPPDRHLDPPPRDEPPEDLPDLTLRPIGIVRSPYRYVHDAPRQASLGSECASADARIELRRGMQNCLKDLRGFDRIWVIFAFRYARGWNELVTPPRDSVKRGVLATRSPHRPNPIGLSCVRVRDVRGRRIEIFDHDLLDGTPVLDVKPYLPYCDAHPDASAGWVDDLPGDAPDHRWE
jgi:tRNA-Thr(GGU) m(6)t(6)A37 methyltransferase TsaA